MNFIFFLIIFMILFEVTEAYRYKVTQKVFFDITIDGEELGRIIIGLFGETVPRTVKNFVKLSTSGISGKSYRGSKIHRIIRGFFIEGGDVVNGDGTGSISAYGKTFLDENFSVKHSSPGFISMVNPKPNSNGCQFFITTTPTPWLNGKNVAFGKVISGQKFVYKIEEMPIDKYSRPRKQIIIANCGLLDTPEPFYVSNRLYKNEMQNLLELIKLKTEKAQPYSTAIHTDVVMVLGWKFSL